jgi:dihydroorotate dehydrogenase electron transfer subunit
MARGAGLDETEVSRPRRLDLRVAARQPAGRDFAWLTLAAPPDWQSLPGQFVNVLCASDERAAAATDGRAVDDSGTEWPLATGLELGRRWPVVRRPFSVARLERTAEGVRLVLLVRGVGTGSRFLAARRAGASVDLVGPLGNPFTAPADDRTCLLVAGGCGVAPIFGLADHLAAAGRRCVCFFGAATLADMPTTFARTPPATGRRIETTDAVEEFARAGAATVLATDDGSAGFAGTVTDALADYLAGPGKGEPAAIYGCGPTPMLRALGALAAERDLACQVSLERFMACGAGLCLSCVAKRRDPSSEKGWTFRLTCREGPVVDARDILWNDH